jgi:hypothetical protein
VSSADGDLEAAAESGHDDIVQLLKDRSMAFCKN